MNTDTIVLEAHICDQRRSYKVTFPATPAGEAQAVAFMDARAATHAIHEWLVMEDIAICDEWTGDFIRMGQQVAAEQPHLVNGNLFPTLYARLHPTCHHGMSADLCMDPYGENHFGTRDWEMAMGF